jgi:crotonobetainyl-CoA:carnitine CoA-transferase CaiB-like acyl-CoA transferase
MPKPAARAGSRGPHEHHGAARSALEDGCGDQATGWLDGGVVPSALGNSHPSIEPFATYRARDGDLMICAGNDRQFRALVAELGIAELADDPAFSTNAARVENRDELRARLERELARDDRARWSVGLLAAGVPAGPIHDVPAAFSYASSLDLDVVDEFDGVRTVPYPARLSRTPARHVGGRRATTARQRDPRVAARVTWGAAHPLSP